MISLEDKLNDETKLKYLWLLKRKKATMYDNLFINNQVYYYINIGQLLSILLKSIDVALLTKIEGRNLTIFSKAFPINSNRVTGIKL